MLSPTQSRYVTSMEKNEVLCNFTITCDNTYCGWYLNKNNALMYFEFQTAYFSNVHLQSILIMKVIAFCCHAVKFRKCRFQHTDVLTYFQKEGQCHSFDKSLLSLRVKVTQNRRQFLLLVDYFYPVKIVIKSRQNIL